MSDEFNKGYFSYGSQRSEEAQRGRWARQEEERRERERAAREQSRRELDAAWERSCQQAAGGARGACTPSGTTSSSSSGAPSEPATLGGCVKGLAVAGAVLFVLAALGRDISGLQALSVWAFQGAALGAVAGAVVYAAIVVLRVALVVVAFVLKVVLWLAVVGGGLYLLAR